MKTYFMDMMDEYAELLSSKYESGVILYEEYIKYMSKLDEWVSQHLDNLMKGDE